MSFIINPYIFGTGGGGPATFPNLWEFWEADFEGVSNGATFSQLTGQANARHMSAGTGGSNKPTCSAAALNGLDVAVFDHFTWFHTADMSALTGSHTFVVIKADDDPASATGAGAWNNQGTSGLSSHYPFTDGNIYEGWGTTSRLSAGNPTPALTSWRVYEIISVSGEYAVLIDGSHLPNSPRGSNTVGFDSDTYFGNSEISFGTGWAGQIAAAYVFTSKQTGADRTTIINYINTRFGLSSS